MAWTFVRPRDPSLLSGRPLLDLGTGDGQTLSAVVSSEGLVVGLDRSLGVLPVARRSGVRLVVGADASSLPFSDGTFETALAGDLFHHLDDETTSAVLDEVLQVLRPSGRLLAWWYERPAHASPDAPGYPRTFEEVAAAADRARFGSIDRLALEIVLPGGPPTVGLTAVRA